MEEPQIIIDPSPALFLRIFSTIDSYQRSASIQGCCEHRHRFEELDKLITAIVLATDKLLIAHKTEEIKTLVDKILTIPIYYRMSVDFSLQKVKDTFNPTREIFKEASEVARNARNNFLKEHGIDPDEPWE